MMENRPAIELCELVGEETMAEICVRFGGQQIYIPHAVPQRSEKIQADFDRIIPGSGSVGVAYEMVAQGHNVSLRTVQRIVCGK